MIVEHVDHDAGIAAPLCADRDLLCSTTAMASVKLSIFLCKAIARVMSSP